VAFRAALSRYKGARLAAIRLAQGARPVAERIRPAGNADEITEHLDLPSAVEALVSRLPNASRLTLSIMALTETTSIPLAWLTHVLRILGAEPTSAVVRPLELGLLAIEPNLELGPIDDFQAVLEQGTRARVRLRVHPAVLNAVRTTTPEAELPKTIGPVSHVRESDGLEAILRLGALWQRVGAEPLRQTHHGTLYKRDRDRLALDPVLAAPIADELKPLSHRPALWLELARRIGLIDPEPGGERLVAAGTDFWSDNAVHLPQMIASAWITLKTWRELELTAAENGATGSALPYLRTALLLLLSTLGESDWVALGDLADHLRTQYPAWDRLSFTDEPEAAIRVAGRNRAGISPVPRDASLLESLLLGAAYPLGLVKAAKETGSSRRVVQLTPLGRYVLALGPSAPPRATFEQFLFVQPNFEVVAYRQGLTPQLVGQLSRFAWWSQIGAALELKLTRESIVHGLDKGATPESMLEMLTRHSQRPLPPGVIDAVRNWATRRERVTYYPAATLIEFGSSRERDAALSLWPESEVATPFTVGERFLLVEDERTVPFDRLRLSSSRDYRRPPDVCVTVDTDGVTLSLDPARSDLLVDAELSRFADVLPETRSNPSAGPGQDLHRFLVTSESLRRGMSRGLSAHQLGDWFTRRTGSEVSPAIQLLIAAETSRLPSLSATRMVVVSLPSVKLLDGLLQHPATSDLLGDRLGPFSVAIPDNQVEPLQKALKELGIELVVEDQKGDTSI
jgi:hypothetical protein